MTPELLHKHLKQSLHRVVAAECTRSLRSLLEYGSAERFLTDLLFLNLHAAGHNVSREYPIHGRLACDLVLHEEALIYIEAKQLHLKDGYKIASSNLSRDLTRHNGSSLGIIYVLDERASALSLRFTRFGGKNRNVKNGVDEILHGLNNAFSVAVPTSTNEALLRTFDDDGRLDVFGFVVAKPVGTAATTPT